MAIYTIRPGFTITIPSGTYTGGQDVDLAPEQFEANKHKLEGVESDVPVLNPGNNSNGDCCQPPDFSRLSKSGLIVGIREQITLWGSFFTPQTTVAIAGANIELIQFESDNELTLTLTPTQAQTSNLTINNGQQTVVAGAITFFDPAEAIVDFRLGGTSFSGSAIEVRNGMTWERTSDGLIFRGRNAFGSWARLVGDGDAWVWDRSQKRELSIVYENTGTFALGIGSRANNPNASSQLYQAEIVGYMSGGTNFRGIYGNTGTPGSGTYLRQDTRITGVKKIVFTNNGEPGNTVKIYNITDSQNPNNWLDNSTLVREFLVTGSFRADEQFIMPFLIPRDGNGTKFLGMILT